MRLLALLGYPYPVRALQHFCARIPRPGGGTPALVSLSGALAWPHHDDNLCILPGRLPIIGCQPLHSSRQSALRMLGYYAMLPKLPCKSAHRSLPTRFCSHAAPSLAAPWCGGSGSKQRYLAFLSVYLNCEGALPARPAPFMGCGCEPAFRNEMQSLCLQ